MSTDRSEATPVAWRHLAVLGGDATGARPLAREEMLVLVGVTGVGKTTALRELGKHLSLRLLPNRRELAERVVFPAVQAAAGLPPAPVSDRLERFRLTREWRAVHPGGLAEALATLGATEAARLGEGALVFDGIRGSDECAWAAEHFVAARFVVLEAPAAVRLSRLLTRGGDFDRAAGIPGIEHVDRLLEELPGVADLVARDDLARIVESALRSGLDAEAVAARAAILVEESRNYDPSGALRSLRSRLPARRLLAVETHLLGPEQVALAIADWWREDEADSP